MSTGRATGRTVSLDSVWTAVADELRLTFRSLRRSPIFLVTSLLTLTVAIAANTTVLSIVDTVLLRALPYRDPANLFLLEERDQRGVTRLASYLTFADWQQQSTVFDRLGFVRGNSALVRVGSREQRLAYGAVTPGFLEILGVQPVLGRLFTKSEEETGDDVAILGYETWQSVFNGDSAVLRQPMQYDGQTFRVIGVSTGGSEFSHERDGLASDRGAVALRQSPGDSQFPPREPRGGPAASRVDRRGGSRRDASDSIAHRSPAAGQLARMV